MTEEEYKRHSETLRKAGRIINQIESLRYIAASLNEEGKTPDWANTAASIYKTQMYPFDGKGADNVKQIMAVGAEAMIEGLKRELAEISIT
jgi:hypothetical protein